MKKRLVQINMLVLLGGIIAIFITGCLPQPMVKPTVNKVIVSQLEAMPLT